MAIVRHSLLWLSGLALLGIWFASAAANFAHGVQFAGHSPYWWIFGLVSAAVDVIKAVVLLWLVYAWSGRRSLAVIACVLVWPIATAWGISSCFGFIATTLSDTVSERRLHTVADRSLERQIADQVGRVTILQDLKIKAPPRDWDRIEGEIGRVEARLEGLRKIARTTQAIGDSNPVGSVLQRYMPSIDESAILFWKSVMFLLAVEVCASLGLVAFAPFCGFGHREIAQTSPRREGVRDGGRPDDSGPVTPPSPPLPRVAERSSLRTQALALLGRLEGQRGSGAVIGHADVLQVYVGLVRENGWTPMTPTKLGQQLALLGVSKVGRDGKQLRYALPGEGAGGHA